MPAVTSAGWRASQAFACICACLHVRMRACNRAGSCYKPSRGVPAHAAFMHATAMDEGAGSACAGWLACAGCVTAARCTLCRSSRLPGAGTWQSMRDKQCVAHLLAGRLPARAEHGGAHAAVGLAGGGGGRVGHPPGLGPPPALRPRSGDSQAGPGVLQQ